MDKGRPTGRVVCMFVFQQFVGLFRRYGEDVTWIEVFAYIRLIRLGNLFDKKR